MTISLLNNLELFATLAAQCSVVRPARQSKRRRGHFLATIVVFRVVRGNNMELYMCGFNAHHQLDHDQDHHNNDITQFRKVLRSPHLNVRCALWSSTVIQSDGTLLHQGYRPLGLSPMLIDGPPPRNIKSIFGDTSGVLGALAIDGSLYLYHDGSQGRVGPEFRKHRFPEESFIVQQSLAIEHLAIADNGEVCTCTGAYLSKLAPLTIDSDQIGRPERGV